MSGEREDGKDHSATSQLCEIVLPQPGNPLLGLADCYSRSSSRVYSEAAVNKCFSSKTYINKPSANTLFFPTIVRCQMACELRKVTHLQKRAALLCLSPFNFILWTEIGFAYPRASQSWLKARDFCWHTGQWQFSQQGENIYRHWKSNTARAAPFKLLRADLPAV